MTTKLEQAARQALEALIKANHFHDYEDEITALREALDHIPDATKMVQEPVAFISRSGLEELETDGRTDVFAERDYECVGTLPLYAAPKVVQEPVAWIDLTGAEIGEVWAKHPNDFDKCVAILEKFKDKNTTTVHTKEKPVAFYIYKPTPARFDQFKGGVLDGSLPWVYDQDPSTGFVARMLVTPCAAPVRTKDLTDDEIESIVDGVGAYEVGYWHYAFARAVLAAYKEKNK